ncbi:DUF58 domain-containing protein [candidate division WOR-3 bacterium]|uniref:DUF58 domain-containing protein n=1 Tax=candidate division WOR-3 bacterium TaxID=2052148 RepID=A0A9D5QDU0_UNCW3|nr:DUF58 domain-containing protein [candidate division WOR-3 bacterium]MBD3364395.1 DUF58 domain-containing protein [candidate division WOR-3 bacterium]
MKREELLKPETLARLRGLDIKARLVVEGFLEGLHRSPYKGFSVEFSEYRPYIPGDEPRRIDWKVYAKRDRFYVKEYQEETNLRAMLLVDSSQSMTYRSGALSKLDYAVTLAAALTFLLIKQKDAVGMATFDTQIREYVPARSSNKHMQLLLSRFENLSSGGETNLAKSLHGLAERTRKRGLVIIFSDLFDDPDDVLLALRHFRHRKHEVILFHILDPQEENFDFSSPLRLVDMETRKEASLDPRLIRAEYRKALAGYKKRLLRTCSEHHIDYNPILTNQSLEHALFRYLEKRRRLR